MGRRIAPPLLVALLVLALPALTQAGLPKTDEQLIVPHKSIGGVKLGMPLVTAEKVWGKSRDKCIPHNVDQGGACIFSSDDRPELGQAQFSGNAPSGNAPGVRSISISLGNNGHGRPFYNTPLLEFVTKDGVGLGSSKHAVVKAFPSAVEGDGTFIVTGGKPADDPPTMIFFIDQDGRVGQISLRYQCGKASARKVRLRGC